MCPRLLTESNEYVWRFGTGPKWTRRVGCQALQSLVIVIPSEAGAIATAQSRNLLSACTTNSLALHPFLPPSIPVQTKHSNSHGATYDHSLPHPGTSAFRCDRRPSRHLRSIHANHHRQAICRGVLLQNQVGTRRRVLEAVQEEPLSAVKEWSGDGTSIESLDGPAALSHHRGRSLGLPRDPRIQERDRSQSGGR